MTKTLQRELGRTVREKREQLSVIREEVEKLLDLSGCYRSPCARRRQATPEVMTRSRNVTVEGIPPSLSADEKNRLRQRSTDF